MSDKYIILYFGRSGTFLCLSFSKTYGKQIAGERMRSCTSYEKITEKPTPSYNTDWHFSISFCDDRIFSFSLGIYSSYIGVGTWTKYGDIITVTEFSTDQDKSDRFRVEDGYITFIADGSSGYFSRNYKDGEKFIIQGTYSYDYVTSSEQ